LWEGLGEGETWLNKESNFIAYLFHPHPTSPIKGEELQSNLNSTTLGIEACPYRKFKVNKYLTAM
jgi:hypothetical protein